MLSPEFHVSEQYDQSIAVYQEILQQYPNSRKPSVRSGLGHLLFRTTSTSHYSVPKGHRAIFAVTRTETGVSPCFYAQQKIRQFLPPSTLWSNRKNQEALQATLHEIQSVHVTTDFMVNLETLGESNLSTQLSTRFRIGHKDTVQKSTDRVLIILSTQF